MWRSRKGDEGRWAKLLLWCLWDARVAELGEWRAALPCRDQNLFKTGYTHWQQTILDSPVIPTHTLCTYLQQRACNRHCDIYTCQVWQFLQRYLPCLFNIPISWSPSLISCFVRACKLTSCWITAFTYHTCQHTAHNRQLLTHFTFYLPLPGLHYTYMLR